MSDATPQMGWFDANRTHFLPQRIYYEDTDFSGVIYHARYLHFLERGRTEALRSAGSGQKALIEREIPLVFAVHHLAITYRAPGQMDDALLVRTRCLSVKGARMLFDQALLRDDSVLVEAQVSVAAMTPQGRPMRIPLDILAIMERAIYSD
jgi:acyl-CoA thioester hydrolase